MPSSVVDQETETRRASIRQACALELDQEMAKLRARKQSELEKSIDELSTEMMDDIERRAVARVAEVDRQIADREKQGLADLERALGGKRAELQTEVSELEDRRCLISMELATLEKGWDAIKAELQTLSEQQNHATETVERWTSVASALGTGADSVAVARRGEKQCSSYLGRFAPCLGNRAPRTKTRDGWPAFPDHTHSGEPATVRAAPFRIREYYCTPPLLVGWERGCCAAERSG
jgi:chromosome segregation ATPase